MFQLSKIASRVLIATAALFALSAGVTAQEAGVKDKAAVCASCHDRMDPLGLAFENFNALGRWRDTEFQQNLDASGRLITGESFETVRELKRILVRDRRDDFYRCLTEKALTYALGRGLDYYDTLAVDQIVDRLRRTDGQASELLQGIVESVPFQKMRNSTSMSSRVDSSPSARKAATPLTP